MHVQANDILILGHKSAVSMAHVMCYRNRTSFDMEKRDTIRYDTIEEFVDSKAEYSALCSTRSQKKKQESRAAARKPRDAASVFFC